VVSGLLSRNSIGAGVWRILQSWLYRRADRIVCLGRDAKALIALEEPRANERLVVIPNWAEIETVRQLGKDDSKLARAQGTMHRFVVLYAGNIGRTHDLELIVGVAHRLERESAVLFLIAATGSQFSGFAAAMKDGSHSNVVIVSLPESRDQQSDTLAAGDVVLITFKAGMKGVSVPSRMYNAMAAGKPLIGVVDEDSELALVIREEDIGWVVQPGDASALARAVTDAYADPERLKKMGRRARQAAETKYSREAILGKYAMLFDDLANESSPK
jgi:glycosyltransferase involved in cell wall biosynthesis